MRSIDYVRSGQSLSHKRMKRMITDEDVRWVFMLDEYFKGQSVGE
jgi:hypothetical protein